MSAPSLPAGMGLAPDDELYLDRLNLDRDDPVSRPTLADFHDERQVSHGKTER